MKIKIMLLKPTAVISAVLLFSQVILRADPVGPSILEDAPGGAVNAGGYNVQKNDGSVANPGDVQANAPGANEINAPAAGSSGCSLHSPLTPADNSVNVPNPFNLGINLVCGNPPLMSGLQLVDTASGSPVCNWWAGATPQMAFTAQIPSCSASSGPHTFKLLWQNPSDNSWNDVGPGGTINLTLQ